MRQHDPSSVIVLLSTERTGGGHTCFLTGVNAVSQFEGSLLKLVPARYRAGASKTGVVSMAEVFRHADLIVAAVSVVALCHVFLIIHTGS